MRIKKKHFMTYWNTYKVFLKLFHLLFIALQPAVVHGSALDGDLSHLQVHLLQLKPTIHPIHLKSNIPNRNFKSFQNRKKYLEYKTLPEWQI